MKRMAMVWLLSATAGASAQLGILGGKPQEKDSPVKQVQLLPERTGLVPGQSVGLAIAFEVQEHWHIYWRNGGESGNQPVFKWRLPEGYELGPMLWPVPRRHIDGQGESAIHTFILEGRPTLLTSVKVPADAQVGTTATLSVHAEWLVCKDSCVSGEKSLSLTLPVVSADQAKPANENVFAAARNRLPVPKDPGKYLDQLSAVASVDKVKAGQPFKVAVILDIKKDFHLNSHEPLSEFLIPTDVFHDTVDGLVFGRAQFPAGREETPRQGDKLSVYRGRVVVTLPVETDAVLTQKEFRISGIATYQACSDKTQQCYPPVAVEWALILPVAGSGETAALTHRDVFEHQAGAGTTGSGSGTGARGFSLDAELKTTLRQEEHSVVVWLLLALLAGLILNVTPCVLPVISIKVLSFVQQASQSPGQVFKLGLAFSVGMMLVFNVLAALATGAGLAWGQHFQSPQFTVGMAAIVFAFGLSLFGVYTLGVPRAVGDLAARADQQEEGYVASIAKGGLATVMGTPCLGPFLGPVLVWATAQPAAMVFLVFNTIGLGMALPYVVLTANPKWLRFVPRPGPWLTTFKQAMAFLLMGTVVYLLYIVEGQLGGRALVWTLAFLVGVSLACWIVGTWATYQSSPPTRLAAYAAAALIVAASGWVTFARAVDLSATSSGAPVAGNEPKPGASPDRAELPWVPFSLEKLEELTAAGTPVLLDITARWCPNCQYNSAFVLNTRTVAEAVEKHGVVPMLADWTAREKLIGDLIEKLAPGASIPLAAVFPAGRANEPIVMLGILTQQDVIDAVREGGRATGMASESAAVEGG